MRSVNWQESEIKLALDLYYNKDFTWLTKMNDTTFEISALSQILNCLDFYSQKPESFRSTGSIRMKLANFMALDNRYKRNSLGNVGKLDKRVWETYCDKKDILHEECKNILSEHLMDCENEDINKYMTIMDLKNSTNGECDFGSFAGELRKTLYQYLDAAAAGTNYKYSKEILKSCHQILDAIQWTDGVQEPIVLNKPYTYREHGGINLAPLNKKVKKQHPEGSEKIGKFVRASFQALIQKRRITGELLNLLQEQKYCKETFGLAHPFLVLIKKDVDIKKQITDQNGYVRYWIKPIKIREDYYCVCKEWFENQRQRYLSWLNCVKGKPFAMLTEQELVGLLSYMQKADERNVFIKKEQIQEKYNSKNMNEILETLISLGVLSQFQDTTKELVIDDFDLFYDILKYPNLYAGEDTIDEIK